MRIVAQWQPALKFFVAVECSNRTVLINRNVVVVSEMYRWYCFYGKYWQCELYFSIRRLVWLGFRIEPTLAPKEILFFLTLMLMLMKKTICQRTHIETCKCVLNQKTLVLASGVIVKKSIKDLETLATVKPSDIETLENVESIVRLFYVVV